MARRRRWRSATARPTATASGPGWTFRAVLDGFRDELRELVELPVQTNEVGRCAALLPGFLEVAAATGMPLRLLEVGASAGLNLRWDMYRYEAGGFAWGPPDSPLRIEFELKGAGMPAAASAVVAERRGCDAAPIDPETEAGRLIDARLHMARSDVRLERMRAAIELAAALPVTVERGSAAAWAAEQLAEPAPGRATVIYHSIVMQYLGDAEREAFEAGVREAGERASAEAPLAWLRMEPAGGWAEVRLTTWPGGEDRLLATAGYHGSPVDVASTGR